MTETNGWLRTHLETMGTKLSSIDGKLDHIEVRLDNHADRMARMEERQGRSAAFYGLVGGLIPALGVAVYYLLSLGPAQ